MRTIRTAAVWTAALSGLDAVPTTIEARIETGAGTGVQVEGEPAASALEMATRVERAIAAVGWDPRRARAVVRTNPAVPTNTQLHDLPAALAILVAAGELDADAIEGRVVVGALKWGPAVEPITGTLAVAELCRNHDWPLVVPAANVREAAAPGHVRILPAGDLGQIVEALRTNAAPTAATGPVEAAEAEWRHDLAEITGRQTAKRALEIAAAGAHPLLLAGPPAAPTTGLALRMTSILPEMSREERLTATRIHSIAGLLSPWAGVLAARPLSAPHFSASAGALLGPLVRTPETPPMGKAPARRGDPCTLRRALPGRHRPVPHQRSGRVGKGGRVEAHRRQPRRDARRLPARGDSSPRHPIRKARTTLPLASAPACANGWIACPCAGHSRSRSASKRPPCGQRQATRQGRARSWSPNAPTALAKPRTNAMVSLAH